MQCNSQIDTVNQIVESGHDYVIIVKKNQRSLYNSIASLEHKQIPITQANETDTSQSRLVQRNIALYDPPAAMKEKWVGLKTVAVVHREGNRQGQKFRETMYYITSQNLSAKELMGQIRGHWGIENKLHWVKDVTFLEDAPLRRGGNAPVNWAIMFTWLITLARRRSRVRIPKLSDYGLFKYMKSLLYFHETTLPLLAVIGVVMLPCGCKCPIALLIFNAIHVLCQKIIRNVSRKN